MGEEKQVKPATPAPKPADKPTPAPAPAKQLPSMGRIVRYRTTSGTERAAIITDVIDSEAVDLVVFNSGGAFPNEGVLFSEDGEPGTWSWPPRQGA